MQSRLNTFSICNATGRVTLTGVVVSECLHVMTTILVTSKRTNPVFSKFAMEISTEYSMDSTRVRLKVLSNVGSSSDHTFIERVIDSSIFGFRFTYDIREGNAIDTGDDGKIVCKSLAPLQPLALFFELARISRLGVGID